MPDGTCSVDGCDRAVKTRGWCNMHYLRWFNRGTVDPTPRPTMTDRFWTKVAKADIGCWEWTGQENGRGYGRLSLGGKRGKLVYAHRFSYELLVGPVPAGLELDHLCSNHRCVRPDHLEPVTHAVNVRRGNNGPRSECQRGHPLTGDNVYMSKSQRACRTCAADRRRERYERAKLREN